MVDHAEYIIGVFDNQKKLRSGTAPVSYTHLDVYKRQAASRGAKRWCGNFWAAGCRPAVCDEAHNYKNLVLYTKMRNVAGLSTSDAQKSSDMFAKCRYMDEITGNRGVIFATGTPVSNSMTELYTCLLYTSRCV